MGTFFLIERNMSKMKKKNFENHKNKSKLIEKSDWICWIRTEVQRTEKNKTNQKIP